MLPEVAPDAAPVSLQDIPGQRVDERLHMATAVWVLREAHGWSQRDLARKIGLPRSYVSKIERAKNEPSAENVERFARAFQIPTAGLIQIAAACAA